MLISCKIDQVVIELESVILSSICRDDLMELYALNLFPCFISAQSSESVRIRELASLRDRPI